MSLARSSAKSIANLTWEELQADHLIARSMGKQVYDIKTIVDTLALEATLTTLDAIIDNIHDVDLPALLTAIGITDAVIDNIHDTDLPAVKADTVAIEGKLDKNLDAAISSRASASALTTHDGKLDTVDAIIDDIHGTDLPAVKSAVDAVDTIIDDIHGTDLPAVKSAIDAVDTIIDDIHGTDLPAVKTDTAAILVDTGNIDGVRDFASAESLDDIPLVGPTDTTEKTIAVTLPTGSTIVKAILYAFIQIMNDSANAHKINIDTLGRKGAGGWTTYFSQDSIVGLPAVDGASTAYMTQQDISALIDTSGGQSYGFKCAITQTSANSIHYTVQYLLKVYYKMG